MTETEEKEKIEEVFGPHDLDVSGFSETVQARFAEATDRTNKRDDYMLFLDDLERAMIGTAVNDAGTEVAVYERELCLRCKMDSYGPNWKEIAGTGASDDETGTDEDGELYTMAVEDFEYNTVRSLPYQYEHAPIIFEAFHDDEERGDKTRWDEPIVARGDERFDDALLGTCEKTVELPRHLYDQQDPPKSFDYDIQNVAVYDIGLLGDRVDELIKSLGDGLKPVLISHFAVDNERFEELRTAVNETVMEKFMYA